MIVADSPFWLLDVRVREGEATSMVCLFVYHWQFLIPDVTEDASAIAQADGAP